LKAHQHLKLTADKSSPEINKSFPE